MKLSLKAKRVIQIFTGVFFLLMSIFAISIYRKAEAPVVETLEVEKVKPAEITAGSPAPKVGEVCDLGHHDGNYIVIDYTTVAFLDKGGQLHSILPKGKSLSDICTSPIELGPTEGGSAIKIERVEVFRIFDTDTEKYSFNSASMPLCDEGIVFNPEGHGESEHLPISEEEKQRYRNIPLETKTVESVIPTIWEKLQAEQSAIMAKGTRCGYDIFKSAPPYQIVHRGVLSADIANSRQLQIASIGLISEKESVPGSRAKAEGIKFLSGEKLLSHDMVVECGLVDPAKNKELPITLEQYGDFYLVIVRGYTDHYLFSINENLEFVSKLEVSNGQAECD